MQTPRVKLTPAVSCWNQAQNSHPTTIVWFIWPSNGRGTLRHRDVPPICPARPRSRAYPTRAPSFVFVISWRPTNLSLKIMITIKTMLTDKVLCLKSGTVVDAILMAAPPTTKNKNCNRDPEMHVSKKRQRLPLWTWSWPDLTHTNTFCT